MTRRNSNRYALSESVLNARDDPSFKLINVRHKRNRLLLRSALFISGHCQISGMQVDETHQHVDDRSVVSNHEHQRKVICDAASRTGL